MTILKDILNEKLKNLGALTFFKLINANTEIEVLP